MNDKGANVSIDSMVCAKTKAKSERMWVCDGVDASAGV